MNIQFRDRPEQASSVDARTAIADCDIHPARATATEFYPYLAKRWHAHLETYDKHPYQGMMEGPPFPKAQPNASRRDAYPPEGGPQGSSLSFMQAQHLDPNNVVLGVLNPLATGQGIRNQDLAAAICSAINDWQIEKWTSKDKRLKGSVVVANEDGPAAAAEIRKRAGDKNFVQVLLLSRNVEPLGQRRYWPIYEAAEEVGLPVGVHAFGFGGNPITASGWPSYYIEEMVGHSQCQQTALVEPRAGGRVRAAPETQDDHGRGRLWLGAVAVVAARQEFRAAAQRGAASQAQAIGIYPRPHLVDHAADGRPGKARASVPGDRLDRLGQAPVRHRLSALGLRRAVAGAPRRRQRRQPRGVLSEQCIEALRARIMVRHVIAPVDELPPGTRKFLTIDSRPIAVFNINGEFFGLLNRCPHQGAALCEGPLIGLAQSSDPGEIEYTKLGEIIRCPWHGWEFDIRTGQSYCDPKRFRAKAYPVDVEPGSNVVKGPYVAETIKVAVESDYVVVDL